MFRKFRLFFRFLQELFIYLVFRLMYLCIFKEIKYFKMQQSFNFNGEDDFFFFNDG